MTFLTAFPYFLCFPIEIRLKIWKQAYNSEGSKIIELAECEIDHDFKGRCYKAQHGLDPWSSSGCRFQPPGPVAGLPVVIYENDVGRVSAFAAFDLPALAEDGNLFAVTSYRGHSVRGERHVHPRRNSPVSPLLQTNMEARRELATLGKLTFTFKDLPYTPDRWRMAVRPPINMYVNFEQDILALNLPSIETIEKLSGCENIRKLLVLSFPPGVLMSTIWPHHPCHVLRTSKLQVFLAQHFPNLKELYVSVGELNAYRAEWERVARDLAFGALKMRHITSTGSIVCASEMKTEGDFLREEGGPGEQGYSGAALDQSPVSYGSFMLESKRFAAIAGQLHWIRQQRGEQTLQVINMVAVQRKRTIHAQWGVLLYEDRLDDRRAEEFAALPRSPFWLRLDKVTAMVEAAFGDVSSVSWETLTFWKRLALAYWQDFDVFLDIWKTSPLEHQVERLDSLWSLELWFLEEVRA